MQKDIKLICVRDIMVKSEIMMFFKKQNEKPNM